MLEFVASFYQGRGGARPLPHGTHWVREHSAPAWTTGPRAARWNTRGASASSGAPRRGSRTESPFFMRIAPNRTGRQHKGATKGHIEGNTACTGGTAREGTGRRQFGGPSTEPADGNNPSTTHTPEHGAGPTPPWRPHPAVPRGSRRANGSEGGAAPAVLGVKNRPKTLFVRRNPRVPCEGIPGVSSRCPGE